MKNEILMRRRNMMLLKSGDGSDAVSERYLATLLKNMESYGYTVSEKVYLVLKTYNHTELSKFYSEFTEIVEGLTGGYMEYEPMYPNFPREVMTMDESDLYLNAFVHYLTMGKLLPDISKNKRLPMFDEITVKVLSLGTEKDIIEIMQNIMCSKTSISETDKTDLAWFFKNYNAVKYMPEVIPIKENAAYICKLYIENTESVNRNVIKKYIKTATDALRLATAMSDGDVSLAENSRFKSISRKYRRMILSILDRANNLEEDMNRYAERWIRLGEYLHPSEYPRFAKANAAFKKLRNNEHIDTFGGKLNELMEKEDYAAVLTMLKSRAGDFARKLDYLLRTVNHKNAVVNSFAQVAKTVSTPVLLQVKNHFDYRNDNNKYRVFFPKGNIAKSKLIQNTLPPIDDKYCQAISKICSNALVTAYEQRDFLGSVYVSEEFKNYYVPFSQRSSSKAMRTIVRGSKLPLDADKSTIRAFIHWKNISEDEWNGRVDVDLSAVMYDKDWNYKEHISYTNLRSGHYKSCHSGDITNAPDGACEFIDVDLDSVKKYGGRYIVFTVNSFTGQNYTEIPECFMGWMEREEPDSGEIFEIAAVKNKIDLTANTKVSIPMVVDVVDKKIIWMDMALKNAPNYNINIENNQGGIIASCMAFTNMKKTTLYELIDHHIKARGIRVDDPADANVVFCTEVPKDQADGVRYITPFMLDVFMSEYL